MRFTTLYSDWLTIVGVCAIDKTISKKVLTLNASLLV